MQGITLQLDRDDAAYIPGEPITGQVSWDLDRAPDTITLRLFWQTSGKGTQDMGIAQEEVFELVSLRETRSFVFEGVEGPYSFSGKLITVAWIIEAVAKPGEGFGETTLTLSPTGLEVRP